MKVKSDPAALSKLSGRAIVQVLIHAGSIQQELNLVAGARYPLRGMSSDVFQGSPLRRE